MSKYKELLYLGTGVLLGIAATLLAAILYLRANLIKEYELGTADFKTVAASVPQTAKSVNGWTANSDGCNLPQTPDGLPLQSFRFCNPEYARELIQDESERKISAILPCGIAFYRKSNGKIYASKLNMPLIGILIGGTPSVVFSRYIEPDQQVILTKIAEKTVK